MMRSNCYNPYYHAEMERSLFMDQQLAGYGWYIKRIDNAIAKHIRRSMDDHQLTMQQSRLLVMLSLAPQFTLTLKELEKRFGAAQSTVAGLVSRMEKKALVQPVSTPGDKRIKRICLTEAGHEMFRSRHDDMVRFDEKLTSLLTDAEKEQLLVLLQKLYEAIR